MYSPSRLSLKIPDSPLEKQAFRSRSFRRILFSACALSLLLAILRSIHLQNELHREFSLEYLSLYHNAGSSDGLSQQPIGDAPNSPLSSEISTDEPSTQEVKELMNQLPEVIRIPFETAVADIDIEGWEDDWFSSATYDFDRSMNEPKLDFVYNWVNGSEDGFKSIKHKYELDSRLNDKAGKWISEHSINRYRDWDELRYSFRSLDAYARNFTNKIQILTNSVPMSANESTLKSHPQRPRWLKHNAATQKHVEILSQEDFFDPVAAQCLPSFDSLSIESQIHNTPSTVDQMVALSDDMFLGANHSAADFFSPLFGPMIGFKSKSFNVKSISKSENPTFGEKPHLHYTSWVLNHRFGERERKVQAHFTHSVSRRVMKEAMASFPSPALRGACERFRGESKFQIYPWYAAFHYSIERFREALLWSFIMVRMDANNDGYLDWAERQTLLAAIKPGRKATAGEDESTPIKVAEGRDRMFYQLPAVHKRAGIQPPLSNVKVTWTSLDGPETIRDVKCHNFHVDQCLAESFDSPLSDRSYRNPDFSTANIFSQLSRRDPKCGDCLIKFMLSTVPRGLEPLLPPKSRRHERETTIKALVKYQHTIIDPDAMFVMVKDAEQAETEVMDRAVNRNKYVTQYCFNDDVMTEDPKAVAKVNKVIQRVFKTLFPHKSRWEE
ncbi:putative udp-glucose 4-epimerase protein [Venturia nashicola]|uniref:Putative udp-glucose 4-epimerase protein n=1 Tax=Venturia nashicola TaxID=86259 RepID=A0A4Z1PWR8_9PEZI|nr:putative udp-glucose 4-epimerase protein [Venturia nashicola]